MYREKMMALQIQNICREQQDKSCNGQGSYSLFIPGENTTEHHDDSPDGRYNNCVHIFF